MRIILKQYLSLTLFRWKLPNPKCFHWNVIKPITKADGYQPLKQSPLYASCFKPLLFIAHCCSKESMHLVVLSVTNDQRSASVEADLSFVFYFLIGIFLSCIEYVYTTNELGDPLDTLTYGYDDSLGWKNPLTSLGGQSRSYDTIENHLPMVPMSISSRVPQPSPLPVGSWSPVSAF